MTDLTKLKELAERATPGPWRTGDGEESPPDCVLSGEFVICEHAGDDVDFIAAANPQAILELIAEVERLRTRLEISDKHPYDGIDTRNATIEGLERLIQGRWKQEVERLKAENEALRKDAERYRWLRGQSFSFMFQTGCGDACITGSRSGYASRFKELEWVDAAIDAALEGGGK